MGNNENNFILKICLTLVVTMLLLLGISLIVLNELYPANEVLYTGSASACCFFMIFGIYTFLTMNKCKKDRGKFERKFMINKGVKLLAVIVFLLQFCFCHRPYILPFVVMYVVYYIAYTIVEACVLTKMK